MANGAARNLLKWLTDQSGSVFRLAKGLLGGRRCLVSSCRALAVLS